MNDLRALDMTMKFAPRLYAACAAIRPAGPHPRIKTFTGSPLSQSVSFRPRGSEIGLLPLVRAERTGSLSRGRRRTAGASRTYSRALPEGSRPGSPLQHREAGVRHPLE